MPALSQVSGRHIVNILIFDSGMGGLSVYQEVKRQLPNHRYDYIFDNAYFPYGEQPEQVIVARCATLISTLVAVREIDLVVIACNTASTVALPSLRELLTIPVVGVVPAIKPAAKVSKNNHIALLATPATVHRAYTDHLIEEFAAHCNVLRIGVTNLVVQAERKMAGYTVDMHEIHNALEPVIQADIQPDTLVLGCTHFPLLKEEIHHYLPDIALVDSGAAIAKRVACLLKDATVDVGNQKGKAFCAIMDNDAQKKSHILKEYGFDCLEELELC